MDALKQASMCSFNVTNIMQRGKPFLWEAVRPGILFLKAEKSKSSLTAPAWHRFTVCDNMKCGVSVESVLQGAVRHLRAPKVAETGEEEKEEEKWGGVVRRAQDSENHHLLFFLSANKHDSDYYSSFLRMHRRVLQGKWRLSGRSRPADPFPFLEKVLALA